MRELLVGLDEAGHRGRKGGIGPHQLFQLIFLSGSSCSEGVKIFFEFSSRPVWTICLIWFRRMPKCAVSGAKLSLASKGFLLGLSLLVCCLVHIFPSRPNFFVLGEVLLDFI